MPAIKFFILLLFFFRPVLSSNAQSNFFDFALNDVNNKSVYFSPFKNSKAIVVIFMLSDCPASQSYTLTLNKLYSKYRNQGIGFIGVFPGNYSTNEELIAFNSLYKISFPLLKDPDMKLAKHLSVEIAPECFVVDNSGTTIYKGRIDDWLYTVGKKRQVITQHNLDDAIYSVIKKIPLKIKETKAIGCFLEYEK